MDKFRFYVGMYGEKTRVDIKITEIVTEEDQRGVVVTLDGLGERRMGVSLQAPEDEFDFRLGVRKALERTGIGCALTRLIWHDIRVEWASQDAEMESSLAEYGKAMNELNELIEGLKQMMGVA